MKRLLILLTALLTAVGVFAQSRIEEGTVESRILGASKEYRVYLPDGYDANPEQFYPVLYLLHGAGGTCDSWAKGYNMRTITDWRISSGFCLPMIIIMPDASGTAPNHRGERMGYYNYEDWRYEDFFFQEFIPEVEKRYRIYGDRDHRAIAGLSMGGDGTIFYAMQRPDLFSSACPLSARVEGVPARFTRDKTMQPFLRLMAKNDMVKDLREASPEKQKEIASVRWYIDVGDDDYLFDGNAHLYLLMRKLQFPDANFRVREGTHHQVYWRTALPEVLTFVSIGFSGN